MIVEASIVVILIYIIYICLNRTENFDKVCYQSQNELHISVVLMLKNNEDYIEIMERLFSNLESNNRYKFTYYIYENNSSDNTKKKISEFMKTRKGIMILENMDQHETFGSIISERRGIQMSNLRNKLKQYHGNLESDYTLLIDSDVIFDENCLNNMMQLINKDNNVMITPYTICWERYNQNYMHYYDSLALITKDNISWKENNNRCMFKECKDCYNNLSDTFEDKYFLTDDVNKVNSAFGGFVLIDTLIYNKVKWYPGICEHHGFCEEVRQHGDIIVAKNIKTTMINPEFYKDYDEIQKVLKKYN